MSSDSTFNEEKRSSPVRGKGNLTSMQKMFIKSSIDMRKKGKMQAAADTEEVSSALATMESEIQVLAKDEYQEMLKDTEHPAK
jgi:hypothetical protein